MTADVRLVSARRLIAESIPHIAWMGGPKGPTEYFNAQGAAYTGFHDAACSSEQWQGLVHPGDFEQAQQTWQHATGAGQASAIVDELQRDRVVEAAQVADDALQLVP